nr:DHH family phosphoesterase [uncultured Peptostreptococcus sp.]
MENKNKISDLFSYIAYLCFGLILVMSAYISYKNIALGLASFIALFILVLVYINKKKNDRKRWRNRVQNASFNFSNLTKKSLLNLPIPLCILEMNGTVSWANKMFDQMVGLDEDSTSIGSNIEDFVGEITLRKVLDESKIIEDEFLYNDRSYTIRYSFAKTDNEISGPEFKIVIYWLDHTVLDGLKLDIDYNKPAIMVIEIDGYEDVIKSTPEDNQSLIRVDIEKIVSKLENATEGQLEKLANDKYVLFTSKGAIKKLEKNKFPILDEARDISRNNSLPVSLSIGVGYDGKTIEETGKFAYGAIDMVLGRGGDQVAIKNKDGYTFFGGKSKGFERKTKVKSRLIGHAFREIVSQSDDILIMGHNYPDMDAMGAAVGIYDICKSYGKKSHIVLNEVNEAVEIFTNKIREDKYFEDIFINHERAIDLCKKKTLVVVVDTHRPSYTECQKLLSLSNRIVVIDHHRRGVEYINETILLFHEIYVSSTCEMVTELIQYTDSDINIHKLTAEGLLGGIYLDTKNFEFKTGVRTFEAASFLRNLGAETLSVKKFFNSYAQDFLVKAEIIQRTEILKDRICISYAKADIDNINIIIAKAADELLNIKNIEASFVLGIKGDTVFVSARSLGDINVHILMEKIGGGGHIDIAGAQIKNMSLSDSYNMIKNIIEKYLEEEDK